MRTRFLRGSTAENNGLTLGEGELSIDSEKHALRLHDGVTPGGFEMVGTQAVEKPPGPSSLLAGDNITGWYGEVDSLDLIDGSALSTELGISEGTILADAGWLKFAYENKTLYVAKNPVRDSISWDVINSSGAVYGETTITLGSFTYKVRLLRGADTDPTDVTNWTTDPVGTHNSEWNRLIYKVSNEIPSSQVGGNWADYSNSALGTGSYVNWTQETPNSASSSRVVRAYSSGIDGFGYNPSTSLYAWRPVLELIE